MKVHVNRSNWEKLLMRWSGMQDTGEVRLICAVIADGIIERHRDKRFFLEGGFDNYCRAINLEPRFVKEQISRSDDYLNKHFDDEETTR